MPEDKNDSLFTLEFEMRVIFYKSCSKSVDRKTTQNLESAVSEGYREIYTSLEKLEQALRKPFKQQVIAVLVLDNYEILKILTEKQIFSNVSRLILLVPLSERKIVTLGYKLHPRFISDIEEPFDRVRLVLENMMSQVLGKKTVEDIQAS